MRRVRTKLPPDKMPQRMKKVRASGQLLRGVFKPDKLPIEGISHDSRYLPAFAACHRADLSDTSADFDLEPVLCQSTSIKRRPESGEPKGRRGEGATMSRKEAGNCRIRENAAAERSRIIRFCLQPVNARCRHRATGCTHKRPAVALCRCRAIHSAPASGLGGHGEWSAATASGLCRK